MRSFRYNEPGELSEDGEGITNNVITVTEDEIRRLYYPYWARQMWRVGKQDQISFEACLEDWLTVHWAWEIDDSEAD